MFRLLILINLLNELFAIPIVSPYDSNGCCISCGYTYCETLLECVRPWEVECPDNPPLGGNPPEAELINP